MTTITEDYVSFETAELLKEKGFEEECVYFYDWDEEDKIYRICSNGGSCNEARFPSYYSMPTLQMAMKWLREVHKQSINLWYDGDIWSSDIYGDFCFVGHFKSYEEASEAAIQYCLKNLI